MKKVTIRSILFLLIILTSCTGFIYSGAYMHQERKVTVICYGDSNTRYYEGDRCKEGDIRVAFSSVIENKADSIFNRVQFEVDNQGYPSKDSHFAVSNFAECVLHNKKVGKPDYCIIGFGTNDIKVNSSELDVYLTNIEILINDCSENRIVPIILGIPWFQDTYAGVETQGEITTWNKELNDLCNEYDTPFVDTYNMFCDNTSLYFNEVVTPKRHFSKKANEKLGKYLYKLILADLNRKNA